MDGIRIKIAFLLLIGIAVFAVGNAMANPMKAFRVCADPNNLPFSNDKFEGFENKIAKLMAKEFKAELQYFWYPHQRGMVRNSLKANKCDVIIGIPKGYDLVLWTKPYYKTGYVFSYTKKPGRQIKSLDDPLLKKLTLGVFSNTPPHHALAKRGIYGERVVQYSLFYDWEHPADQLIQPMKDLAGGKVDVLVLWGPLVGYYIKKGEASLDMELVRENDTHAPMRFDISMGVKKGNKKLKAQLEQVLDRKQAEIRQILKEFGVPFY